MIPPRWRGPGCGHQALLCALILCCGSGFAHAEGESVLIPRGLLPEGDGRWGLGVGFRVGQTQWRGESRLTDLVPLLSYEGSRAWLRGTRGGVHLIDRPAFKLDAVAQFRLDRYTGEGSRYLSGMLREHSLAGGLEAIFPTAVGEFSIEGLTDISHTYKGTSFSVAWAHNFDYGKVRLRPSVSLDRYSADLANYYYGVSASESRPDRPAYTPGSAGSVRVALHASYRLTDNSYLFGNIGLNRVDGSIADSPVVERQMRVTAFGGYLYRFGGTGAGETAAADGDRYADKFADGRWSVRVARGWNAQASLLKIIPGLDFSLSPEHTGVLDLEIGRLIDQGFNGWPVDIYVNGAYTRYLERNLQDDANGVSLSLKAFYYGFPWSHRVKTRFGFGAGLSYVDRVPTLERRSILGKNPNTTKLMNHLDVSVDFSVGDVIGAKSLRDTFLGFAVIHRSAIFGASDLFSGVDGGSNYNSIYLESLF